MNHIKLSFKHAEFRMKFDWWNEKISGVQIFSFWLYTDYAMFLTSIVYWLAQIIIGTRYTQHTYFCVCLNLKWDESKVMNPYIIFRCTGYIPLWMLLQSVISFLPSIETWRNRNNKNISTKNHYFFLFFWYFFIFFVEKMKTFISLMDFKMNIRWSSTWLNPLMTNASTDAYKQYSVSD